MAKYKINHWKELIREWQESGKTRQTFCLERDLTLATFSYRRTRIKKLEAGHIETQEQETFIRYRLPAAITGGYLIEWPEGMKLRLPPGIGIVEIASLITALRCQR